MEHFRTASAIGAIITVGVYCGTTLYRSYKEYGGEDQKVCSKLKNIENIAYDIGKSCIFVYIVTSIFSNATVVVAGGSTAIACSVNALAIDECRAIAMDDSGITVTGMDGSKIIMK